MGALLGKRNNPTLSVAREHRIHRMNIEKVNLNKAQLI